MSKESNRVNEAISILLPGISGVAAVCFSNPLDLIKTRLQLDSEMSAVTERKYKGWRHCVTETYRQSGTVNFIYFLICCRCC